ncbi:uncharacterized protein LOC108904003 [Anoplophora glabripennis]|uniref:uncharacterized protein LOC108904003 n=1 Tax=Anoplophora glabripennis TaxID=217634 RepID=UPI0008755473|nr:uncharacterized protein LOC108904003 [Anoplophora glabripennis]
MCRRTVCLFLLLISLFQACTSLKCYSCSAQVGPNDYNDCEWFHYADWERHKVSTCHFPDAVCAKYVVDYSGNKWVHRDCKHHDVCSFLSATNGNDMNMLLECETCADKDLCNSAPAQFQGLTTTVLVLLCGKFLI